MIDDRYEILKNIGQLVSADIPVFLNYQNLPVSSIDYVNEMICRLAFLNLVFGTNLQFAGNLNAPPATRPAIYLWHNLLSLDPGEYPSHLAKAHWYTDTSDPTPPYPLQGGHAQFYHPNPEAWSGSHALMNFGDIGSHEILHCLGIGHNHDDQSYMMNGNEGLSVLSQTGFTAQGLAYISKRIRANLYHGTDASGIQVNSIPHFYHSPQAGYQVLYIPVIFHNGVIGTAIFNRYGDASQEVPTSMVGTINQGVWRPEFRLARFVPFWSSNPVVKHQYFSDHADFEFSHSYVTDVTEHSITLDEVYKINAKSSVGETVLVRSDIDPTKFIMVKLDDSFINN